MWKASQESLSVPASRVERAFAATAASIDFGTRVTLALAILACEMKKRAQL